MTGRTGKASPGCLGTSYIREEPSRRQSTKGCLLEGRTNPRSETKRVDDFAAMSDGGLRAYVYGKDKA